MPTGELVDLTVKILAALAAPLGGLAIWAVTRHVRLVHLEKEHETLRRDHQSLEGNLEEARRQSEEARQISAERYDRLRATYEDARDKFYRVKAVAQRQRLELEVIGTRSPLDSVQRSNGDDLNAKIVELDAQLATAQSELAENQRRIEDATQSDGRIWLRPPVHNVPTFRPRSERKNVIISVLNLKGGVGKTTITANLAATFAKTDSALLVDLDYQRSLSMLLVPNRDRILLHRAGSSVQHFLASERHSAKELTSRLQKLSPEVPNCALLANSDSRSGSNGADGLEETETRLMIEWLFDRTRPDPRFFIREALHDRTIEDEYRYVFLDCPPRLTTACVSALASSDYVLIPVVPDAVSTRAAENLLTTLRGLRDLLNPQLRVLAVVPNMVRPRGDGLIKAHTDALIELREALQSRWDEPIRIADACIHHNNAFGLSAALLDSEQKFSLAIAEVKVAQCFDALAEELLQEIQHHESRRTPTVPAQSGSRTRSGR